MRHFGLLPGELQSQNKWELPIRRAISPEPHLVGLHDILGKARNTSRIHLENRYQDFDRLYTHETSGGYIQFRRVEE